MKFNQNVIDCCLVEESLKVSLPVICQRVLKAQVDALTDFPILDYKDTTARII